MLDRFVIVYNIIQRHMYIIICYNTYFVLSTVELLNTNLMLEVIGNQFIRLMTRSVHSL